MLLTRLAGHALHRSDLVPSVLPEPHHPLGDPHHTRRPGLRRRRQTIYPAPTCPSGCRWPPRMSTAPGSVPPAVLLAGTLRYVVALQAADPERAQARTEAEVRGPRRVRDERDPGPRGRRPRARRGH